MVSGSCARQSEGGQNVCQGVASVTQGATITFQWYSSTTAGNNGGTPIAGATAASFALPTDLTEGTYHYFCELRAQGAVAVRTVSVSVAVAPKPEPPAPPAPVISIDTQPAAPPAMAEGAIPEGTTLTVAASVTEGATLTYQWYTYDGENQELFEPIEGATSASYTLPVGLTAGEHWYVCLVTAEGATAVQTDPVSVTVTEREQGPTYTIGASTLPSFGSLEAPYTQPDAQTVTVTNTGTGTVTLTQPTATSYIIGSLSATELAPGATATFTVRPKANLSAGPYNETINIIGTSGVTASVEARFTVNASTPPPPPVVVPDPLTDNITYPAEEDEIW